MTMSILVSGLSAGLNFTSQAALLSAVVGLAPAAYLIYPPNLPANFTLVPADYRVSASLLLMGVSLTSFVQSAGAAATGALAGARGAVRGAAPALSLGAMHGAGDPYVSPPGNGSAIFAAGMAAYLSADLGVQAALLAGSVDPSQVAINTLQYYKLASGRRRLAQTSRPGPFDLPVPGTGTYTGAPSPPPPPPPSSPSPPPPRAGLLQGVLVGFTIQGLGSSPGSAAAVAAALVAANTTNTTQLVGAFAAAGFVTASNASTSPPVTSLLAALSAACYSNASAAVLAAGFAAVAQNGSLQTAIQAAGFPFSASTCKLVGASTFIVAPSPPPPLPPSPPPRPPLQHNHFRPVTWKAGCPVRPSSATCHDSCVAFPDLHIKTTALSLLRGAGAALSGTLLRAAHPCHRLPGQLAA